MTAKRDYYEELGVPRTATESDIKRAFRDLAKKHHPDVAQGDRKENEAKFKEISEAYAVLSDPQKRSVYDQQGHAGFDQRYSTEDIFRGADFSSVFEELGSGGSIFESLFGGFDLSGGRGGRRGGRGADLELELSLTFEEAAKGTTKTVTLKRRELCAECKGEGGERQTCSACQGSGQVRQSAGFMVMVRTCSRCNGQGGILKKACPKCRGEGRIAEDRKLQVKVPAGIESGMRLRLTGEGEGGARGRGDLYAHLRVGPHPVFRRDGPHLIVDYPIDLSQAALGAELDIPTLDGRVSMKVPAGTQSGTVFRVRGKGLPDIQDDRRNGDILVRVVVETPTNLTRAQRKALEDAAKQLGDEAHPQRRSFLQKVKDILER